MENIDFDIFTDVKSIRRNIMNKISDASYYYAELNKIMPFKNVKSNDELIKLKQEYLKIVDELMENLLKSVYIRDIIKEKMRF